MNQISSTLFNYANRTHYEKVNRNQSNYETSSVNLFSIDFNPGEKSINNYEPGIVIINDIPVKINYYAGFK